MLPPDATQAVFATELDLTEMQPEWESVVMRLDAPADMANLARMSRGSLEYVDNHKVVALPTNAYAVQFSDNVVGAMTPTNRQSVGRWLRDAETQNRSRFVGLSDRGVRLRQQLGHSDHHGHRSAGCCHAGGSPRIIEGVGQIQGPTGRGAPAAGECARRNPRPHARHHAWRQAVTAK